MEQMQNSAIALLIFSCSLTQNMAFQSEQRVKTQIMTCLGPDQLFRLLSDTDIQVLMKTLGLLRNLLSNKPVSTGYCK